MRCRVLPLWLALSWLGCGTSSQRPAPAISVRGTAYIFSQHGGPLPGAHVSILELPGHETTCDADGHFHFDNLPGSTDLTLRVQASTVPDTLTRTFHSATDLDNVNFQAPDFDTYALLSTLTGVTPSPDRCQLALTVTRFGVAGNDTGGNGEPGAVVTIDPPLPDDALGPVYFAHVTDTFIFPDATLTASSDDGGALFLNVPPGTYVLRAHKEGTTFSEAHVRCVAGQLTNAAPPWGLAVLSGGIGPHPDGGP